MRFFDFVGWVKSLYGARTRTIQNRPHCRLRLEHLEDRLAPATFIWDGGGADSNWKTQENWVGNVAPTGLLSNHEDLVFSSNAPLAKRATNNNFVGGAFNSITIGDNNYTLSGSKITLGDTATAGSGNIIVNDSVAGGVISLDIAMGGTSQQFFTVQHAADLTISGKLSTLTGSTVGLTKEGSGILILTADNSDFTGQIKLDNDAGIVRITNAKALGDTSVGTTVGTNAQLQVDMVSGDIAEPLILNGPGINNDGTLENLAGNNKWIGNITLDSDASIGAAAGQLDIAGLISDLGAGHNLTKEGTGQIIFSHVGGNTYRGLTTINNGILTIQSPLALGAQGTPQNGTIVTQSLTKTATLQIDDPNFATDGGGFTVLDEQLTLNGPGVGNRGALTNLQGDNTWASSVTLGSPSPNVSTNTNIGVAGGTLTISGIIGDRSLPDSPFTLTKVDTGKLIFNNANAYKGATTVAAGILNIRDSQSLGPVGGAGTAVLTGAALELEVDTGFDAHGRDLSEDSVTDQTGNGPQLGLRVAVPLTLSGTGVANTGALHSISGINQWTATVALASTNAGIAVDSDPNPSNTIEYFTHDYSFTVSGVISGGATFHKEGTGQLILPTSNTFTGQTIIEQGWVTIQSETSLGGPIVGLGDTVQPGTTVLAGAALHFRSLLPDPSFDLLENLVLSGTGITHPFALINQKGALESLGGNNSVGGPVGNRFSDIQLNGNAGIGVEEVDPASAAIVPSELTITSSISDAGGAAGGITKLGSRRLILQGDGSYSGDVNVNEGVVRIQHGTALGLKSTGTAGGTQTYTDTSTTIGAGNSEVQAITVPGSAGAFTLTFNGQTTDPINHPLVFSAEVQQVTLSGATSGGFTLTFNGQTSGLLPFSATAGQVKTALNQLTTVRGVGGSVAVSRAGNVFTITFGGTLLGVDQPQLVPNGFGGTLATPATVTDGASATATEVEDALNALSTISGLGSVTVNKVVNVYTVTFTDKFTGVNQPQLGAHAASGPDPVVSTLVNGDGAALELEASNPLFTGGVSAGLGIWNERLVLDGSGNATFGDAPLTIRSSDNMWRGPITLNTSATINVAANSRLNVFGVIDDAPNASVSGSDLTVTGGGKLALAGTNTFRGTTFVNQGVVVLENGRALGETGVAEVQTVTVTGDPAGTFTLTFNGQTTTLAATATADDVQAALNALTTIKDVGGNGSVTVSQAANVYTVTFGGSLVGFNQPQMVATGFGGATAVAGTLTNGGGGTVVGNGTSLELEGSLAVSGEPLILQGKGAGTAPKIPQQWFSEGPAPINNGQTAGNQAVSGRVTGIAVDPSDSNVIYIATAGGGAWKTKNGGQTWLPLFDKDGNPELQVVAVNGTAGTFTLTFNGQSTGPLAFNATAAQVALALNTLSTIGGVAGSVSVTLNVTATDNVYTITFGGSLFALNLPQLGIAFGGGADGGVTTSSDGFSSLFGGAIAVDPNDPRIIYFGTGEANSSADSYYGTGVYKSVDSGKSWVLLTNADGSNPLYGLSISKIAIDYGRPNDIPNTPPQPNWTFPFETVNPPTGRIYVAASDRGVNVPTAPPRGVVGITVTNGGSGYTSAPLVVFTNAPGDTGSGAAATATVVGGVVTKITVTSAGSGYSSEPKITLVGGGGSGATAVVNTISRTPGVYRFDIGNGGWFDLTAKTSGARATLAGQSGPPNTPGPDDDFSITFAQSNATWSDLSLTYFDNTTPPTAPPGLNPAVPVLYASFGVGGVSSNAVLRTENPQANAPLWYVGDPGTLQNEVQQIVVNPWNSSLTYQLTFNGFSTPASGPGVLVASDDASVIQAALNALASISGAGGSVTVAKTFEDVNQRIFSVTFGGTMINSNQPQISSTTQTGLTVTTSTIQDGSGVDTRSSGRFPPGSYANIKFSTFVAPNPNPIFNPTFDQVTLYAAVTNPNGTIRNVFRSANGGKLWVAAATPPNYMANQGHYDSSVFAVNATTVVIGGQESNSATHVQQLFRSTDSGATWTDISVDAAGNSPHTSTHALAKDIQNRVIVGTDGGVWRFDPASNAWTDINGNLAITQFNGVAANPTNLTAAFGGSRFNGTEAFTGDLAWTLDDNNDGGQVDIDPKNPNNVYHIQSISTLPLVGGISATLRRSADGGATWSSILTVPGTRYAPFVIDSINTARLVIGGLAPSLQESLNQGTTWVSLDANLPITVSALAIATYQGKFVPDPDFAQVTDKLSNTYDPDTIYVTNGTSIFVTKNHGVSWASRGLPGGLGSIADIVVDPSNRDTVYVVRSTFSGGKVFRSTNAGQSWTDITNNLPEQPAWKLVLDPRTGDVYVGTDNGVWLLPSGSTVWRRFGAGLPYVQVKDLELNQTTNTLLAGTYGRSMYRIFLDDGKANAGALRAVSGTSTWTGPVYLTGASPGDPVYVGAEGTQVLQNGISAAQATLLGVVSDLTPGGNSRLVKVGQGNVVLAAVNTYAGVTEVKEGVLVVQNPTALGKNAGNGGADTIVDDGASINLHSDLVGESLQLFGDGILYNGHFTGALRNTSNDNTYKDGTITLKTDSTIGVETNTTLTIGATATIDDGGQVRNLTKESTGTLVFAGANTYLGLTKVNQGALRVANDQGLGGRVAEVQTLTVSGSTTGTFSLTFKGKTTNSLPATANAAAIEGELNALASINDVGGTVTVVKIFEDATKRKFSITFGGNLFGIDQPLMGATGFSGATALVDPSVDGLSVGTQVLDGAQLQLEGDITVTGENLKLSGSGIFGTGALLNTGGDNIWRGPVTLSSLPGFAPDTTPTASVLVSVFGPDDSLTIDGPIDELPASGLTKIGPGKLVLAHATSYSGTTNINTGTLNVQDSDALGGTALAEVQRITVVGTGTFTLTFNGQTTSPLAYNAATSVVEGALAAIGASVSASRMEVVSVTPAGTQTESIYTLTFLGAPANQPQITAAGIGATIAAGSTAADGGIGTLVTAGAVLEMEGSVDVADEALVLNGDGLVTENAGALRSRGGDNAWNGPVTLASASTIGVDDFALLTIGGVITGSASASLTKVGPGRVELDAVNTYSGLTNINEGEVQVGGNATPTASIAKVALGGGTLGGTGTVGDVTVASSGGVDPGDNAAGIPGTLHTGPETWNAGTTFYVNLDSTSSYDQLAVTGDIDITGAKLDGLVAPGIVTNDQFTILTTTGGTITGTFVNTSGKVFLGGVKFDILYTPTTVVLTRDGTTDVTMSGVAIPNPALYGDDVEFQVTLVPEPGAGNINGPLVSFVLDGDVFNPVTAPVVNNMASVNASDFTTAFPLTLGAHQVVATLDNPNFTFATATIDLVVSAATTTTITEADPSPSTFGDQVAFTVTVAGVPGAVLPSGTVTLMDTFKGVTTTLGVTTPLTDVGGVATATFTTGAAQLLGGNHVISAVYDGDISYQGSTSPDFSHLVDAHSSTTTITQASPNPSAAGQQVTFTVTVEPNVAGVLPTGTLAFFDGVTLLGNSTPLTNVGGVATATFTSAPGQLAEGVHPNITAVYMSDGNFANSTSPDFVQTVLRLSNTSLTSSLNPAPYGSTVSFTSMVTGVGGTPTGTLTFTIDAQVFAPIPINPPGSAVMFTPPAILTAGTHTVTVDYSGDAVFAPSTKTLTQNVIKANTTTKVTQASPASPSTFGDLVTFTATVTPTTTGGDLPTGTVTFKDGTLTLGNGTLQNIGGVATATFTTVTPLTGGLHTITAVYNNDINYNPSTSPKFAYTVNKAGTVTTIISSTPSPSGPGQAVTFTVTVTPTLGGVLPTGKVVFKEGKTILGTSTVLVDSGGVATATFTISALVGGTHNVYAVYVGNQNYLASASAIFQHTVLKKTFTTLTSSANPATIGQSVTFFAHVGAGATGTVTFYDGGIAIGSDTLDAAGNASFTPPPLPEGTHNITAVYSGDAVYFTSTGALTQRMLLPATALAASVSRGLRTFTNFNIVVRAIDVNGQTVSNYTGSATLTVLHRPLHSSLLGKTKVRFSHGVAKFTKMMVTKRGTYIVKVTTSTGLEITFSFRVTSIGRR